MAQVTPSKCLQHMDTKRVYLALEHLVTWLPVDKRIANIWF